MLADFLTYVREQSLFQKNDRVLLAVSGGVDSVVLAHLFHLAKVDFGIAHCNFSLRGEASDEDQSLVENLANKYNVPFHTINFDTNQYATENKVSIQMAARELRYQWFEKLTEKHSYKYICTAHHHSDSIETVLFNISKGTGISGVRGILSKNGNIIRPLLFATKSEIEQYAKDEKLEWREDSSNASDKYHRNHIRHHILPHFEHINPSFENTAKSTLERLNDAEQIVLAAVDLAKEQLYHREGENHFFGLEKLKKLSGSATISHHLLKPYGFNYSQSKNIIRQSGEVGKVFLSSSHQANIDRTHLIVSLLAKGGNAEYLIEKGTDNISLDNVSLHFEECGVPKNIPTDQNIGCFDLDKVAFPLTVRKWEQGDRFCPLGMSQQKKVSDFLIDNKIPLNLKDNVKVLVSNGQIIWVIGHRIDDRVKISKSTIQTLQASLVMAY